HRVVTAAHAGTPREKVLALRDYLRMHVTYVGVPQTGRPFLRQTAAETLRSGRGWCGERSRAFVCMAAAVGVRAQRLNLFGRLQHTVAEAELAPGQVVVVDCFGPPMIPELESLDRTIQRPEYDDYSTVNLKRLGLTWLFGRIRLQFGIVTY